MQSAGDDLVGVARGEQARQPVGRETHRLHRRIGRRPREFSNLEVIFFEHGGALVERESTDISTALDRRKGREGQRRVKRGAERGGGVLFWLVPKVHQDPDDAVLPAARTLLNVVFDDVAEYVDRVISRGEAA